MMRPDAKVEKVYLYPKPVDFRKSIDGLAALVELDIKVAVFGGAVFLFLEWGLFVLIDKAKFVIKFLISNQEVARN
ncbi:IS66 family insertion sequence element accessory protein TnpB [Pseudomonas proteolytica]|uniref:IS66 family insertion sequence element accessory protein TnpB n=1 Tax=Pseudomonas proteolytica TaxID=219574 RepID=UPI001F045B07|nr:IS66 family insertion sequence element accessory protein TnpB [Pseudomonas proteolytica]